MLNKDVKLIGIDMDGTLLNSHQKVSDVNKAAVKEAVDKGILVVVSTGRVYPSARIYARYTGVRTPIICCNGALIKDDNSNETLFSDPMKNEQVQRCLEIILKYDVYYHIFSEDTLYAQDIQYSTKYYTEFNKKLKPEERIKICVLSDYHQILERASDSILKLLVADESREKLDDLRHELEKFDDLEVSSSWSNNIEIMKKGVNKGHALSCLAEKFNIKKENVMAIGDSENDIPMLKFAGLSVAMGNALDIVKNSADFVTLENDKDGVAYALKKFIG